MPGSNPMNKVWCEWPCQNVVPDDKGGHACLLCGRPFDPRDILDEHGIELIRDQGPAEESTHRGNHGNSA